MALNSWARPKVTRQSSLKRLLNKELTDPDAYTNLEITHPKLWSPHTPSSKWGIHDLQICNFVKYLPSSYVAIQWLVWLSAGFAFPSSMQWQIFRLSVRTMELSGQQHLQWQHAYLNHKKGQFKRLTEWIAFHCITCLHLDWSTAKRHSNIS